MPLASTHDLPNTYFQKEDVTTDEDYFPMIGVVLTITESFLSCKYKFGKITEPEAVTIYPRPTCPWRVHMIFLMNTLKRMM
jgi:hypothetical protein